MAIESKDEIFWVPEPGFEIQLVDMGGATSYNDDRVGIINTRQYRGPEVTLECQQWDYSSDMWSVGCILMEMYTGSLLFPTHDEIEHLAMIEKLCGPIPLEMVKSATDDLLNCFYYSQKSKKKVDECGR